MPAMSDEPPETRPVMPVDGGAAYCRRCRAPLAPDAAFCPRCGEARLGTETELIEPAAPVRRSVRQGARPRPYPPPDDREWRPLLWLAVLGAVLLLVVLLVALAGDGDDTPETTTTTTTSTTVATTARRVIPTPTLPPRATSPTTAAPTTTTTTPAGTTGGVAPG